MHMDVCLETGERKYWEGSISFCLFREKRELERALLLIIMLEMAAQYFQCEMQQLFLRKETPLMIKKSLAVGPKAKIIRYGAILVVFLSILFQIFIPIIVCGITISINFIEQQIHH